MLLVFKKGLILVWQDKVGEEEYFLLYAGNGRKDSNVTHFLIGRFNFYVSMLPINALSLEMKLCGTYSKNHDIVYFQRQIS
jgi:hypothetical protein